jgi:hypothetical protein
MKSDTLVRENLVRFNYGILVYDGDPAGNDYSGAFIRDYLQEQGLTTNYKDLLPEDMKGYSAAFLSFGNWGSGSTILDAEMSEVIIDYLEHGGKVYMEGADPLGYDQPGNTQLLNLFGLFSASDGTLENPIDNLSGKPAALTHDMVFYSSSQDSNYYIDKYVLLPEGINAFTESDYGIVAAQHTGANGCKTFCFSYCLAKLDDGEFPSTREELLQRIIDFFDITTAIPVPPEPEALDCRAFPNPVTRIVNLQFTVCNLESIILKIYNVQGQEVATLLNETLPAGEHTVRWDAGALPAGVYYYQLRAKGVEQVGAGKLVIK